MRGRRSFLSLGILVLVLFASFVAGHAKLAARTDGNGVPISRYDGVFGGAGGALVQIAVVGGWPIVHVVPTRNNGEWCGIGRPAKGGLGLGGPYVGPFVDREWYSGHASLGPDDVLALSVPGFQGWRGPRRPLYRPRLESMWMVDGKSSIIVSCAPTFEQRIQLLWMSLTGK